MTGEGSGGGPLTIIVVPEGGGESRTLRLSRRALRLLFLAAATLGVAITLMAGTWWYLAARAARVGELEARIRTLEEERARVVDLARQLEVVERKYARIRGLFGSAGEEQPSEVWLPPPSGVRVSPAGGDPDAPGLPTSWPLTQRGFVTQGLLEGMEGEHPGLDIAVPTDSYIRAAGGGTVVDLGDDPVYGKFVVLDHGDGYTSLYAHASVILVERGHRVRQNEVIALSGSTGRSTAPHLHFEILHDGEAVDPATMVIQP